MLQLNKCMHSFTLTYFSSPFILPYNLLLIFPILEASDVGKDLGRAKEARGIWLLTFCFLIPYALYLWKTEMCLNKTNGYVWKIHALFERRGHFIEGKEGQREFDKATNMRYKSFLLVAHLKQ